MSRFEILKRQRDEAAKAAAEGQGEPSSKILKKNLSEESRSIESVGPSAIQNGRDLTCSAIVPFIGKSTNPQETVELFRKGEIGESGFTKDELHKVKGRFTQARQKSAKLNKAYESS